MIIETLTTFPECYDSYMNSSIMKLAQEKNILDFKTYNLRKWAKGNYNKTDDKPYGGGPGQLLMCEPIFSAYDEISASGDIKPHVVMCSPSGKVFNDKSALELSKQDRLLFICGHYEGIDERVYTLANSVYSIGDYVLTSGELASMVIIDAVVRKIPNVLGAEDGAEHESFVNGLLEYPQYTRPEVFRGMKVPEILLSGNHAKIAEWKKEQSIKRTKERRPDLINNLE